MVVCGCHIFARGYIQHPQMGNREILRIGHSDTKAESTVFVYEKGTGVGMKCCCLAGFSCGCWEYDMGRDN